MALRYLAVAIALAFFLFPIVWIASISIKNPADYLSDPPIWIPQEFTFRHYQSVMAQSCCHQPAPSSAAAS